MSSSPTSGLGRRAANICAGSGTGRAVVRADRPAAPPPNSGRGSGPVPETWADRSGCSTCTAAHRPGLARVRHRLRPRHSLLLPRLAVRRRRNDSRDAERSTGQQAAAAVRQSLRQGAYPTHEYKGLVFAYLGPPGEKPNFPIYDTFEIEGMEMVPYEMAWPCNWLQVLDAILDPVHTSFLHAQVAGAHYSDGLSELGEIEFHRTPIHMFATNTRRVGDTSGFASTNWWYRTSRRPARPSPPTGRSPDISAQLLHPLDRAHRRYQHQDHRLGELRRAWRSAGKEHTEDIEKIEQGEALDRPLCRPATAAGRL